MKHKIGRIKLLEEIRKRDILKKQIIVVYGCPYCKKYLDKNDYYKYCMYCSRKYKKNKLIVLRKLRR